MAKVDKRMGYPCIIKDITKGELLAIYHALASYKIDSPVAYDVWFAIDKELRRETCKHQWGDTSSLKWLQCVHCGEETQIK